MTPPKISIVIPVFNNAGTIARTCRDVEATLDAHAAEVGYEFVCVNDGSADDSWAELQRLRTSAPAGRFVLINFTRNFGQVAALLAGYRHATGNAIVSMSADLQDPAELIWTMVQGWQAGEDLVIAARAQRNDGWVYDRVAELTWNIFRKLAVPGIPKGGFDFFLMSARLRDEFVRAPESNLFMQGRLLHFAGKPRVIGYERRARAMGKSQTSFGRKLKYFIDGIAGYSYLPMRCMSVAGLLVFFAGLAISAWIAWHVSRYGSPVPGWASLMIVVLLLNGLIMVFLGVMGEYIWRALEETRKRPHYMIDEVVDGASRGE